MTGTVKLHAQCDRCGARLIVDDDTHNPPVGWADAWIRERHAGSGWTNSSTVFCGELCWRCVDEFRRWMEEGNAVREGTYFGGQTA